MYPKLLTFAGLFPLLIGAEPLPLNHRPGCNADNCLRALRRHTASDFCMTYTTAVVTATSAIPSNIAVGCDSQPSQVSSACSCLVTPTPCPTDSPTQVVQDPGFELPTPTAGFNEGPWNVVPVTEPGFTFGPFPEYDISGTTSHTGLGAL